MELPNQVSETLLRKLGTTEYCCCVVPNVYCLARATWFRSRVEKPRVFETAEQAATRAACEACDIYPDEFVILRDVAPAIVYDKSGGSPVVMTIFCRAGYQSSSSRQ